MIVKATAVVILVPPAAPTIQIAFPSSSVTIVGLMELKGLFPGFMKLAGEGGRLNLLVMLGYEKSSIWSFKMMPVEGDMKPQPKLKF